ncbi:DbpA RNA binding domain-containing protein [Chondromyces apiculatus]|uniref:DbpA RNA binding domain-containing protein n=1 Tax=Chondromyces apiculatus TaxID=51 RepID=UPI0009DF9DD1
MEEGEGRGPARGAPRHGPPGAEGRGPGRKDQGGVARLFISAGRSAGIRPSDLVGAIANEASLNSSVIGNIEISDHFSVVEVPEGSADNIIGALSATRLKGRKVQVRRDRDGHREGPPGTGMAPPRRPKR